MIIRICRKLSKKMNQYYIKNNELCEINTIKKMDNNNIVDYILKSNFKNRFINYCGRNKINENILFYLEIELYQKCNSKFKRRLSTHIYDKYLRDDSQFQINICNQTKLKIEESSSLNEKFNDAALHIKGLLTERAKHFLEEMEKEIEKEIFNHKKKHT